jgi:RimJ/RimL family protein N-acetyltransferase
MSPLLIGERKSWGQSYGSEAWIAVCKYMLDVAGMHKMVVGAVSSNKAMLAIIRKAGMIEDGRRLRHCLIDGVETDMAYRAQFNDARK